MGRCAGNARTPWLLRQSVHVRLYTIVLGRLTLMSLGRCLFGYTSISAVSLFLFIVEFESTRYRSMQLAYSYTVSQKRSPSLATELSRKVMQSAPSVCPSDCFRSIFLIDWPLTSIFCVCVDHNHILQGIESQGHMSRVRVRVWARVSVSITLSIWHMTSIEGRNGYNNNIMDEMSEF